VERGALWQQLRPTHLFLKSPAEQGISAYHSAIPSISNGHVAFEKDLFRQRKTMQINFCFSTASSQIDHLIIWETHLDWMMLSSAAMEIDGEQLSI
jgi:hypothetical protein